MLCLWHLHMSGFSQLVEFNSQLYFPGVAWMHLLVVALSFPSPQFPFRGTFLGEQVRLLSNHIDRITVVSPTTYVPSFIASANRGAAQASLPQRYEFVKDRCEVLFPRYVKAPGNAIFWWTTAQWYRIISKTVAKINNTSPVSLIHANAGSVSAWSAIQVARKYRIPCVVTYQGTEVHTILANRRKGWKLCRDSFRFADLNIPVSRSLESILKEHAQPQGRCEFLLRGVDHTRFFPSGEKAKESIVLFVGRIEKSKGVFELLSAWDQVARACPDSELWMVGPDQTGEQFMREVRSHGHTNSIKVTGPLPLSDVASLMRKAQVLCLPSHREGTPNCIMEALASGLPVIATRVGGIPDIVEHNKTGILVDTGDVQGLAAALKSLLQDSTYRARMGAAGHAFALRYLDAQKTTVRLVELYKELISFSYASKCGPSATS